MSDYGKANYLGFISIGRHDPTAVYTKPPATPSDQAEYHTAAQWHLCHICGESWLCREHHAHRHPGCAGKPYVFSPFPGELAASV